MSEIKANVTKELKAITKEGAYQDGFKKWKHRWDTCVRWGGEYFERGTQIRNFQIKYVSYDLSPRVFVEQTLYNEILNMSRNYSTEDLRLKRCVIRKNLSPTLDLTEYFQ